MQQVESARAGASEQVSEVDLSDANDLRATLIGLQGRPFSGQNSGPASSQSDAPLLVHFGDGDFQGKYHTLLENIGMYRARTGRLESLDMRFNGEVVANPEPAPVPKQVAQQRPAKSTAGSAARKNSAKSIR